MRYLSRLSLLASAATTLLFAVSSHGVIIIGETATATGTYAAHRDPNFVVNDAGVSPYNPLTTDLAVNGSITHGSTPNQPTSWFVLDGTAVGDSITIDLGQAYDLGGMRIWNWNESDSTYLGIENYDLETSPTGLSGSWTLRQDDQGLAQATGTNSDAGTYFGGLNWPGVRFVRLTIVHTYVHPTFGDEAYGGLSEVMFATVPEPSTCLLLCLGGIVACIRSLRAT